MATIRNLTSDSLTISDIRTAPTGAPGIGIAVITIPPYEVATLLDNYVSESMQVRAMILDGSIDVTLDAIDERIKNVRMVTRGEMEDYTSGQGLHKECLLATNASIDGDYDTTEQTLTALSVGVLTVDGENPPLASRICVKDAVDAKRNGIYDVIACGSVGSKWVLKRSDDFNGEDNGGEVTCGAFVFIQSGTRWHGSGWRVLTPNPITVDTTEIVWVQTSEPGVTNAGFGLLKTGTTIYANSTIISTHEYTTHLVGAEAAVRLFADDTLQSAISHEASARFANDLLLSAAIVTGGVWHKQSTVISTNVTPAPTAVIPQSDAATDLGRPSYRFDNAFIAGAIIGPTNLTFTPQAQPAAVVGRIYFDNGTSKLRYSPNGVSFVDVGSGGSSIIFDSAINSSSLANGGYFSVTGTAPVYPVTVLRKRTVGTYNGYWSTDYGMTLAAMAVSDTEVRVYNLSSSTINSNLVKLIYIKHS